MPGTEGVKPGSWDKAHWFQYCSCHCWKQETYLMVHQDFWLAIVHFGTWNGSAKLSLNSLGPTVNTYISVWAFSRIKHPSTPTSSCSGLKEMIYILDRSTVHHKSTQRQMRQPTNHIHTYFNTVGRSPRTWRKPIRSGPGRDSNFFLWIDSVMPLYFHENLNSCFYVT